MALPNLSSRSRSLMLAVALVAIIVWVGVMGWRRSRLLDLAQHFREQSASYATLEQQQLDFAKQLERLEIEVAVAEPPAAGAHASVWKAHRENVSHARAYIKRVKQQLDSCERYGAVRRYLDRLVRKYEDAANRPWMRVEADSPPP